MRVEWSKPSRSQVYGLLDEVESKAVAIGLANAHPGETASVGREVVEGVAHRPESVGAVLGSHLEIGMRQGWAECSPREDVNQAQVKRRKSGMPSDRKHQSACDEHGL